MFYRYRWFIGGVLALSGSMSLAPTVIAQPRPAPIPCPLPWNRLSRDLTNSASEDFLQQGQIRLEREIRRLAKNRELLNEDVLKVAPDERSFPEEIKERQEVEGKGQK